MITPYRILYCEQKIIGIICTVDALTHLQFAPLYFIGDRGNVDKVSWSRIALADWQPTDMSPYLRIRFGRFPLTVGNTLHTPDLPESAEGIPEHLLRFHLAGRYYHAYLDDPTQPLQPTIPVAFWFYHLRAYFKALFAQAEAAGQVWDKTYFEANPS